jgi:predicted ArsR family transcriptional regulator
VIALLAEVVRRDLYEFVRRAPHPVTRDQAAAHVGISRKLAAFHLDKLVAAGLLRSRTDVPAARLGRRPKVYEPSDVEVTVSLPPRRYDLLAEILLDALEETPAAPGQPAVAPGTAAEETARHLAHRRGAQLGAAARSPAASRLGPERAITLAAHVLDGLGYQPQRTGPRQLILRNCPFHRLAQRSRALVCGLNHAFCAGLLAGMDAPGVTAELIPSPRHCCVVLTGR